MSNQFSRTELLLGKAAMEHLAECRVAVFGIGGVGGYVCEALSRSGVGAFDLIEEAQPGKGRRSIPGSTAFVPSVAGLIIAGEVIKDLVKNYQE